MNYFLINGKDFSHIVSGLNVTKTANYNAQTNAAGNTVVDYINSKRTISATFIPMLADQLEELLEALADFGANITFLDPQRNAAETAFCIVPDCNIDYYTIRANKVMTKPFTLNFTEL